MNSVLEDIVSALQAESPGLHEDTLLIVMGDHAQTLSGDHGGGTPEEVGRPLMCGFFVERDLPEVLRMSNKATLDKVSNAMRSGLKHNSRTQSPAWNSFWYSSAA
jgi:hypothetical protein